MADITTAGQSAVDKIINFFSSSAFLTAIGWLILGIVIIAAGGVYLWYTLDKRKFRKVITAFEIVGDYYQPAIRDKAKTAKLGKGGFEILYLKKLKTWKLAYGGRIGKDQYYFFIDPIGYWYNGALSASIHYIDEHKGLIPVVTTNPTMRAQYTALEKHIDSLHKQKEGFWDKYGSWVLTGIYIAIIGIFSWLSFREVGQFLGSGSELASRMSELADQMNRLAVNLNNAQPSGLVNPS